jgi:hypothetical protein
VKPWLIAWVATDPFTIKHYDVESPEDGMARVDAMTARDKKGMIPLIAWTTVARNTPEVRKALGI